MKDIIVNMVCFPLLVIVLILSILAGCIVMIAAFVFEAFIIPTGIDESNMWEVNKRLDDIIDKLWDYVDK